LVLTHTLAYPGYNPTPTTTNRPTTSNLVYYDGEYDEDSSEGNWPELINPIPTSWPTSNWWGSIDHIRYPSVYDNEEEQYRYRFNHIAATNGKSSSSTPKPSPYFQLLLAGLQVRLLVMMMPVYAA